ncbi:sodium/calcium exchanger NCL2-like isoform X2 [Zingiber officinale]|uniref:sodium/calcium exchanger NCL2-like isoform X2 n=1 Tax=Zingiber officinale TaxID=94328 RepID=UPI001C4BE869|nr:sodium/calcium exchanger NCL2-like isoform X2 [Zingiber officinale]
MAPSLALMLPRLLLPFLFLALFHLIAIGRPISTPADEALADLLLSDGITPGSTSDSQTLLLPFLRRPTISQIFAADQCEQTYGFLPCTTTVVGNMFLIVVYGFLMYKAATYLSSGSELLLKIMGPGIVGGLFLPILGALPDAMLILVSGISGSKETAQNQVSIGMGLLAGSTVMLLTTLWGSCIIVGKSDLSDNSTSIDPQDTQIFSLFGSGVSTDVETSYAARIMVISIIPFVIVQLPQVFNFPSGQRLAVLLSLIVAVALLVSYCVYQVFQPWIQRRRLAYVKHKHVISGILKHAQMQALGRLVDNEGTPNVDVLKRLFRSLDMDSDRSLSRAELRALIIGLQVDEIDLDMDDAVDKIMDEFDTSRNSTIEEHEFIAGISNWLTEAKRDVGNASSYSKNFMDDFHTKARGEHDRLIYQNDEVVERIDNPGQIYGGVTMNNTLCLAVFLALVYLRHLTWDFSAEVLIILIVCVVMGLFTSFRTTFPLWTCFLAFLFYPLSLILVYVLDFVFGWS